MKNARRVRTESGSTYLLSNGRLTREGTTFNPYMPPEFQLPEMVNRPFVNVTAPAVGESWRFSLPGVPGPFTTSEVVAVDDHCANDRS